MVAINMKKCCLQQTLGLCDPSTKRVFSKQPISISSIDLSIENCLMVAVFSG